MNVGKTRDQTAGRLGGTRREDTEEIVIYQGEGGIEMNILQERHGHKPENAMCQGTTQDNVERATSTIQTK